MISSTICAVGDEPFCLWGYDLGKRNREFLDSIDHRYFEYLAELHGGQLESDEKQRAAIALRSAYHHGLETLFLLLGALIQAPDAVYAWVARCKPQELRRIVRRISDGSELDLVKLKKAPKTWNDMARIVHQSCQDDASWATETADDFGWLWAIFAQDYLDQVNTDEYNSIKHGFRVRAGGFRLEVGEEIQPGVAAPPDRMKLLGASEFGSSFFRIRPVGPLKDGRKNLSFSSTRVALNWTPQTLVCALQVISMSVQNVSGCLKIVNGAAPNTIQFFRFADRSEFEKAWRHTSPVRNFNMDFVVDDGAIPAVTKEDCLRAYHASGADGLVPK